MPEQSTRRQYPTVPASVTQARGQIREFLEGWGVSDANDSVSEALLIVSELASNAVMHTDGVFTVSADLFGDVLHMAVKDTAEPAPTKTDAADDATSGRGLMIVGEIASDWGWKAEVVGKTIWAELRIKVPTCTE